MDNYDSWVSTREKCTYNAHQLISQSFSWFLITGPWSQPKNLQILAATSTSACPLLQPPAASYLPHGILGPLGSTGSHDRGGHDGRLNSHGCAISPWEVSDSLCISLSSGLRSSAMHVGEPPWWALGQKLRKSVISWVGGDILSLGMFICVHFVQ